LATRAELLLLDEPTSGLDPLMAVAFREAIIEAKDRGQTVFLSSHILTEVEALCDRVGILRAGRLVDEGTLAELRHLGAQTFDVTFAGSAPALSALNGVTAEPLGPSQVRFRSSARRRCNRQLAARAGRKAGCGAEQPRALARGDLRPPLRRA
jgi:ABC-2 type transport system ATP-binding protein